MNNHNLTVSQYEECVFHIIASIYHILELSSPGITTIVVRILHCFSRYILVIKVSYNGYKS